MTVCGLHFRFFLIDDGMFHGGDGIEFVCALWV